MKNLELNVTGIECSGCVQRIKKALFALPEVIEVDASSETPKVSITFNVNLDDNLKKKVITIIEDLDFVVEK